MFDLNKNFLRDFKNIGRVNLKKPSMKQEIEEIIRGALDKVIDEALQGLDHTVKNIKKFEYIIVSLGYPPHGWLSVPFINEIVKAYDKDPTSVSDSIDDFMCNYFNASLIMELQRKWESVEVIKNRLPILRNIIMAHNQGMYNVSIPTIMTQFEGVLADAFMIKSRLHGGHIPVLLKTLFDKDTRNATSYDDIILNYFKNNILVQFTHGKPINSQISRHAVLHGGDIKYGTQANSIKLILTFDYIVSRVISLNDSIINKAHNEL